MPFKGPLHDTKELEQQSMAMKASLKNEVALLQTLLSYSISFSLSNVNNFFLSSILKNCIKIQGKENLKVVVLCSCFPQNLKLGIFT